VLPRKVKKTYFYLAILNILDTQNFQHSAVSVHAVACLTGVPINNVRIFIFKDCILLRLLLQAFRGRRQSQLHFSIIFYCYYIPTTCFGPYGPSSGGIYIYIYTYWLIPKELFLLQRISCSCLDYQLYIYISFMFWRFFAAVCMYLVDMISLLLLLQ
jgi:hypothetical protein